jgi:hypothetical protein
VDCLYLSKGEDDNPGGRPKPSGLEPPSAGAERGNYPEAKPKREGLKGRLACTTASYSALWPKVLMHYPLHPTALSSRRSCKQQLEQNGFAIESIDSRQTGVGNCSQWCSRGRKNWIQLIFFEACSGSSPRTAKSD